MQILFISDEVQIINFLSGLQAEAIMPNGNVEITGISENSSVAIICSGENAPYTGTIISIDNSYSPNADGKWLSLKFIVRRNSASFPFVQRHDQPSADA